MKIHLVEQAMLYLFQFESNHSGHKVFNNYYHLNNCCKLEFYLIPLFNYCKPNRPK